MQNFIVEFLVRSTLIAIATGAGLAALRLKSARVRHRAWMAVCLAMLVLPAWIAWGPRAEFRVLPSLSEVVGGAGDSSRLPDPSLLPSVTPNAAITSIETEIALSVYLAAAVLLLTRLAIGTVRANSLLRNAGRFDGYAMHRSCAAPMTVGWFQPEIVLPEVSSEWSREQFDTVMAHERQHVIHRDPLAQWIGHFQRAIFWFHPLSWWLEQQLTATAEEACDEAVLAEGRDARQYSEHLLAIARDVQAAGGGIRALAMPMSGHCLPSRIRRILAAAPVAKPSAARIASLAATCLIASVLFASGTLERRQSPRPVQRGTAERAVVRAGAPVPAPKPETLETKTKNRERAVLVAQANAPQSQTPQAEMATPYRKWVDEDVVYIITAAEREAFLRLQSDPERNRFIEQFWLRRDPSPATPINEMQEEHYRRIAYTMQRYSFGTTPGWKTDRGMTYIRLGPPDEKEEHAAASLQGQTASYARERWRYRFIERVGSNVDVEFVDRAATGEFRMTVDPNPSCSKGQEVKSELVIRCE